MTLKLTEHHELPIRVVKKNVYISREELFYLH